MNTCLIDRCGQPVACQDLCDKHFMAWLKHGDKPGVIYPLYCRAQGCWGRRVTTGGHCLAHQRRADGELDTPVRHVYWTPGSPWVDYKYPQVPHAWSVYL